MSDKKPRMPFDLNSSDYISQDYPDGSRSWIRTKPYREDELKILEEDKKIPRLKFDINVTDSPEVARQKLLWAIEQSSTQSPDDNP